jgi:DNA-binding transcriptional regulator LsrR (DeoR family)
MLINSLKQVDWIGKEEVHIGFAGGHAMRLLVQIFARMLSETDDELPKKIVFHALVAGFDVLEPTTDPNTFFTLFQDETKFSTEFGYVGLQAPPRVQADQYESLRNSDWFNDSYKRANEMDILVTSAANWSDTHSTFRKSMLRSPSSFKMLDQAGCAGDILWLPVGPDGPLELETDIRSMTLLELREVSSYVRKGKHVYLVLGPCAECNGLKSEVLSAILTSKSRLISHLISDTGTVREVLRKLPPRPGLVK